MKTAVAAPSPLNTTQTGLNNWPTFNSTLLTLLVNECLLTLDGHLNLPNVLVSAHLLCRDSCSG